MIPAAAVGYLILAGLLLWFVTGTRGRWRLKLAAIATVLAYGFLLWAALDTFTGWPSRGAPPAEALFIAGAVREPDAGDPGAIYLWLAATPTGRNPLRHQPDPGEPRAYRLPYSRQGHRAVARAQQLGVRGEPALLRFADARGQRIPRSAFRAYRLPPAQPPSK